MEEVKVALDSETTQFIVVKLGDEQYGIDIKFVDNIVRMHPIFRRALITGITSPRKLITPFKYSCTLGTLVICCIRTI